MEMVCVHSILIMHVVYTVNVITYHYEGAIISNSTYSRIGYSVTETSVGSSVLSVLMVASFSLSNYTQGRFTCLAVVGNPIVTRMTSANTPFINGQCKSTFVNYLGCCIVLATNHTSGNFYQEKF